MRVEQTNLAAMGDSAGVEAIAPGTHEGGRAREPCR